MAQLNLNLTSFDVFWTNALQGFGFGQQIERSRRRRRDSHRREWVAATGLPTSCASFAVSVGGSLFEMELVTRCGEYGSITLDEAAR
jgi:hypothetical protein